MMVSSSTSAFKVKTQKDSSEKSYVCEVFCGKRFRDFIQPRGCLLTRQKNTGPLISTDYNPLFGPAGFCNAQRIILASVSGMTAIVNRYVHGRHADCCLTVHGPSLLDNRRLFLEQRREGSGREHIGLKQRGRKGGEREKGDCIDNHATLKQRGEDRKMLWATKQLISLNLSTMHNATAHYRPIRHYNALLTEVY